MYNHQLDTFIKTAELGSFSKAAEALYISPTAVIKQLNIFEDRCGFKLFDRSSHGVTLTPAGRSLYEDARTIVRFSEDALAKARRLTETSEYTVRVGTSLLYKCRLLPGIWAAISGEFPEMKIEILPMAEYRSEGDSLSMLGVKYDMWEGIYCTTGWKGRCRFLELSREPICCAVAKNHRFAKAKKLTMQDLNGEYLVMPIENVSAEMDEFRSEIRHGFPTVQIIDSPYYGLDTFTLCEVNPYILITQPVYSDIHTNLVTIPLETNYTMPYGLIYANEPAPAVKKFLKAAQLIAKERNM